MQTEQELPLYLRTLIERGKDNETILLYLEKDHCISWSLSTLKRRLREWNLRRHEEYTPNDVRLVIQRELKTPRKLIGIKPMHQRLRKNHHMLVKRDHVEAIMVELNHSRMVKRRGGRLQIGERRQFYSKGPNWSWHLDGYDKLLGYKRREFPFAIHGCVDSYSRRILWMRVYKTNSSPNVIARYFYDAIVAEQVFPRMTRSDAGNEVGILAQCQLFLHRDSGLDDVHRYGSSVTNQCIESWWCQLRKYHGQYWMDELKGLKADGLYDPDVINDRLCLTAVYMPLIGTELSDFVDQWNAHRIRKQKRIDRPCGIPEDMFYFPDKHGGVQCGYPVKKDDLDEIARRHHFDEDMESYLPNHFTEELIMRICGHIDIYNARDSYILLRHHFGFR